MTATKYPTTDNYHPYSRFITSMVTLRNYLPVRKSYLFSSSNLYLKIALPILSGLT